MTIPIIPITAPSNKWTGSYSDWKSSVKKRAIMLIISYIQIFFYLLPTPQLGQPRNFLLYLLLQIPQIIVLST